MKSGQLAVYLIQKFQTFNDLKNFNEIFPNKAKIVAFLALFSLSKPTKKDISWNTDPPDVGMTQ